MALFGISGNCGAASATVFYINPVTFGGGFVTSDSNGNYNTGAVLTDGTTYNIYPSKLGFGFGPRFSQHTISGANISGVNFTYGPMSAVLSANQLTQDTFTRADENPLGNGVWVQSPLFDTDVTIIHNNICTINLNPPNVQSDSNTWNIAIDWTSVPDQWIEFQLHDFGTVATGAIGVINLYLRTDAPNTNETVPCYRFIITGPFSGGSSVFGVSGWLLDQLDASSNITHVYVDFQPQIVQQGDVLRFGVIGGASGHLYVLLNGSLLYVAPIAESIAAGAPLISSGIPGFQLDSSATFSDPVVPTNYTDVGVVNFKGGSASGSFSAVGTVVSCSPRTEPFTWEIVYTYPADAGGLGENTIVVGPNQPVQQWSSPMSFIQVPTSPGTASPVFLACPDIVKWGTFGIGTFGGTKGFPQYFIT
jgi:hypothetical protein